MSLRHLILPLALIAAGPLQAGSLLSCRMSNYCVNEFDCETMKMTMRFSTDGRIGYGAKGEGELMLDDSTQELLSASYEVNAYGVLTVDRREDDGSVSRLVAGSSDGVGVAHLFMTGNNMSTLFYGTCSWL